MTSRTNTPRKSRARPSAPDSTLVDLSAIAEKYPVNVKRMVLDMSSFDASKLTLLEVLDMADVSGVEPSQFASLMETSGTRKYRMMYALGWVIARRADPSLTFKDVMTWKMEIVGQVDLTARSNGRDKARVNAALLAGVTPTEADSLTVGELAEYRANKQRARRRA